MFDVPCMYVNTNICLLLFSTKLWHCPPWNSIVCRWKTSTACCRTRGILTATFPNNSLVWCGVMVWLVCILYSFCLQNVCIVPVLTNNTEGNDLRGKCFWFFTFYLEACYMKLRSVSLRIHTADVRHNFSTLFGTSRDVLLQLPKRSWGWGPEQSGLHL